MIKMDVGTDCHLLFDDVVVGSDLCKSCVFHCWVDGKSVVCTGNENEGMDNE